MAAPLCALVPAATASAPPQVDNLSVAYSADGSSFFTGDSDGGLTEAGIAADGADVDPDLREHMWLCEAMARPLVPGVARSLPAVWDLSTQAWVSGSGQTAPPRSLASPSFRCTCSPRHVPWARRLPLPRRPYSPSPSLMGAPTLPYYRSTRRRCN